MPKIDQIREPYVGNNHYLVEKSQVKCTDRRSGDNFVRFTVALMIALFIVSVVVGVSFA